MSSSTEHTETYHGRKIKVEAFQDGAGWRWRYVIDAEISSESTGTKRSSADLALKAGIAAAKARADEI